MILNLLFTDNELLLYLDEKSPLIIAWLKREVKPILRMGRPQITVAQLLALFKLLNEPFGESKVGMWV